MHLSPLPAAQGDELAQALQRAAFVRDHDSSAIEGTSERQFEHPLLRQVTYDTQFKVERTQGRGAEFLAMSGKHAERAGAARR